MKKDTVDCVPLPSTDGTAPCDNTITKIEGPTNTILKSEATPSENSGFDTSSPSDLSPAGLDLQDSAVHSNTERPDGSMFITFVPRSERQDPAENR